MAKLLWRLGDIVEWERQVPWGEHTAGDVVLLFGDDQVFNITRESRPRRLLSSVPR